MNSGCTLFHCLPFLVEFLGCFEIGGNHLSSGFLDFQYGVEADVCFFHELTWRGNGDRLDGCVA